MTRLPTLLLLASLLGAAAAQAPAPARPPRTDAEKVVKGACSEAQSRNLFTGCDADGDDRLDVFEAGRAIAIVRGARDVEGFARFDEDRDGFVAWPEFDRALRATLDRGVPFRIRVLRPDAPTAQEPTPRTPQQLLLRLYDRDGDGAIDDGELRRFSGDVGLPPLLLLGLPLARFDRDGNGRLDVDELAPLLAGMPVVDAKKDPRVTILRLPAPWNVADGDRDGALDPAELAAALRKVDERLAEWSPELVRALDKDRDGKLQQGELPPDPTPPAARAGS